MADKSGKWSKRNLKLIWDNYVENKVWKLNFNKKWLEDYWDLNNEAPCPYFRCSQDQDQDGKMLRTQYEGMQNGYYQWSVDHIDGNPNNNDLNNLWPMHLGCNKEKGKKQFYGK